MGLILGAKVTAKVTLNETKTSTENAFNCDYFGNGTNISSNNDSKIIYILSHFYFYFSSFLAYITYTGICYFRKTKCNGSRFGIRSRLGNPGSSVALDPARRLPYTEF